MIGGLRGQVLQYAPPLLSLDVSGVIYELMVPLTWQATAGEQYLWVHTQLREDALQLYGFASDEQRQLFKVLIKVNGVGPKMALAILSATTGDELAAAVQTKDAKALTRLPGVGLKTAERLIVELSGRFANWHSQLPAPERAAQELLADAVAALCALGYSEAQASKVVKQHSQPGLGLDQLLRLALRSLAS